MAMSDFWQWKGDANNGAGYIQQKFKKVKSINGNIAVDQTAASTAISGDDCTVNVLSGNTWINPIGTASANATSIKLTGTIDLNVSASLSYISDSAGATMQIIVWEV